VQRAAEKPNENRIAKRRTKQDGIENHHKQMKSPYVVYADFECILKKILGCMLSPETSFTVKTEKHVPCGFSYIIARSDGVSDIWTF